MSAPPIHRCYKCQGPVDPKAALYDVQGPRHFNCDLGSRAKYPAFTWPKDRVLFKKDPVVDGD
jgi:hypothetical protein